MLTFTSVARVWPFWLVVGRCRVRIFFLFFYFFFSVVEKGGGPDPLDPPSGSAPGEEGTFKIVSPALVCCECVHICLT